MTVKEWILYLIEDSRISQLGPSFHGTYEEANKMLDIAKELVLENCPDGPEISTISDR
jgi:hypothetical protein